MKTRTLITGILALIVLMVLAVGGCMPDIPQADLQKLLNGTSLATGWAGADIAYRREGNVPAHVVVAVAPGSPAAKAGLQPGDKIWFVGLHNASRMNTIQVAKRLQESAPRVTVQIERQGQQELLSCVLQQADTPSARRPGARVNAASAAAPAQESRSSQAPAQENRTPQAAAESRAALEEARTTGRFPYTTEWGLGGKLIAQGGMLVQRVTPGSPGADGGLKPGDVIVAMDGKAVKDGWDFLRPPYVPVTMRVEREGATLERTVVPKGMLRLEVGDLDLGFPIPGVPAQEPRAALSAVEALDCVNVLDRVFLAPDSGQVAIVGHYDARFATGNIPYLDLLKTALAYPSPLLNLETSPEMDKAIEAVNGVFKTDLPRLVDAVRGHPGFGRERQLMIRELARGYGITPEEYALWYNFVKIDKGKPIVPPQPIRGIQLKALANLGYTEAASALESLHENTSDAASRALRILGLEDQARAICADTALDAEARHGALMAAAYFEIPKAIGAASERDLKPLRGWYAAKTMDWQGVVRNVQGMLMPYARKNNKKSNIMVEAFSRIYLSSENAQYLDGLPTPYALIAPIDLDGNSQLARIMYEADYALKSMSVKPELFRDIPGSLSRNEYQHKHRLMHGGDTLDYHQWLEPKQVGMQVSPDRALVDFQFAEMRYLFSDYGEMEGKVPNKDIELQMADWCNHFMDNYDTYAHILPAFHKVREAAKIIALARWAQDEGIRLDLGNVAQERWDRPDKVPAFWVLAQGIFTDGKMGTTRAFEGGVTFKPQGGWTRVTPSTSTTTEATAQLALSAGIGRMAVQSASEGDLEQARYLAELSAQAMTGRLSKDELAKLHIEVPSSAPAPISPAAVLQHKERVKETYRLINELAETPAPERQAQALGRIEQLYPRAQQDAPVAASDHLKQLQTGQLAVPAAAPPQQQPMAKAEPATENHYDEPATESPCGDPALHGDPLPLTAERRAFLNDRLFEARERLKHINTALRNLIRINEGQRAQMEEMTREISAAYDESVDRAWSVVFDLMIGLPADKFLDNYEVAKSSFDTAIKSRTALLSAPLSPAATKRLQSEILRIQRGKEKLDEIYQGSERLLHVFKGTNYGYEIDTWNSQTKDENAKMREAGVMLGKLFLDHPKLGGYLESKTFFAGNRYYQVAAMGRMAYYGTKFFLDILAQQMVWEPLQSALQSGQEKNVQGMERLRQKAQTAYREIGCLESALNK